MSEICLSGCKQNGKGVFVLENIECKQKEMRPVEVATYRKIDESVHR
jgi:hypothetical protein